MFGTGAAPTTPLNRLNALDHAERPVRDLLETTRDTFMAPCCVLLRGLPWPTVGPLRTGDGGAVRRVRPARTGSGMDLDPVRTSRTQLVNWLDGVSGWQETRGGIAGASAHVLGWTCSIIAAN